MLDTQVTMLSINLFCFKKHKTYRGIILLTAVLFTYTINGTKTEELWSIDNVEANDNKLLM